MAVWSVGVIVADINGDKAVTHFYLPSAYSVVRVQEFIDALAPLIDILIEGQIVGATATLQATLPAGLKATPNAAAAVERGARFGWITSLGNLASNRLSTFKDSYLVGESVNKTDAAVIAFVNAVVTGLVTAGGTESPVDTRGEDITGNTSAVRQHKKER